MEFLPFIESGAGAIILSIVFTLFKPADWSRQRKEFFASAIALLLGVAVVIANPPKDGYSLPVVAGLISTAFAASQVFYKYVWEKFGGETIVRNLRNEAIPGYAENDGIEKISAVYRALAAKEISLVDARGRVQIIFADFEWHGTTLPKFLLQPFEDDSAFK